MDNSSHLHLPTPPDDVPSFGLVLISLVAIRNSGGKWCATHETRGWYMPAGRIDYGESIETGAKREAIEEAGIEVELKNIVRIDFQPLPKYARFRTMYYAEPKNPAAPLRDKSQADDEIIEAAWVTPEELKHKKPLRSLEMIYLFEHISNNPEAILSTPASFIETVDGNPVDHSNVTTPTIFSVTVIVLNSKRENVFSVPIPGTQEYSFFHFFMERPKMFDRAAMEGFQKQTNSELRILGYLKLRYAPPHDQFPHRKSGHMNVVVVGEVQIDDEELLKQKTSSINIGEILCDGVEMQKGSKELLLLALDQNSIQPAGLIDFESAPLRMLCRD